MIVHCKFYIGIYFIIAITMVGSTPPDYCFQPLNKSDCNLPPTPVFSFYKPGSRCEIEYWRGCPTMNKFDDEFICSHYCIGRLLEIQPPDREDIYVEKVEQDYCGKPLNTEDCNAKPVQVYTYTNNSCEEEAWLGCETINKFDDKQSCEKSCIKNNEQKWHEGMLKLPIKDLETVSKLIDKAFKRKSPQLSLLLTDKENQALSGRPANDTGSTAEPVTEFSYPDDYAESIEDVIID